MFVLEYAANAMLLPVWAVTALFAICFVAGLVRGFSGFALSAVAMAGGALILPPFELLPIFLILEMAASALMFKNGFENADRGIAYGLVIGSAVGLPIGLMLTLSVSPDISRIMALALIVVLAVSQLRKVKLGFLATRAGLYLSGVAAGIATGISGVGGMVVALYVLASNASPLRMRASLVLFLAISSCVSFFTHIIIGTMSEIAFTRGLVLVAPTLLGVVLGKMLFVPKWEGYYKPFCLVLLICLALFGILRLAWG